MIKKILTSTLLLFIWSANISAQEIGTKDTKGTEKYGNTLNLGLGIGYYGYVGHSFPIIHANYEFDAGRNFTLAPFITVYTYQDYYYWGNPKYPYRNYNYRQTMIPIGLKGTYYFDKFLGAGSKWDFYLAGSLGLILKRTKWENAYNGSTTVINHGTNGIYFDGHVGAEYHVNKKVGLFLDLSSGISTFGLAVHK
jgi:hypothetical protein